MDDIIKVKHRGSFHVGGEKVKLENAPVEDFPYQGKFTFHSDPNGTHWAKQMYVQYTELAEPVSKYLGNDPRWAGGLRHPVPTPRIQCLRVRRGGARSRQLGEVPGDQPHAPDIPFL